MTQDLYKQKKSLELDWEQEHLNEGRYTLKMVRIDDKIKEIVTQIKLEEARQADLRNKISESQAEITIAT
jgi:phosphoglycerate-specific signal transduction histidine kinase